MITMSLAGGLLGMFASLALGLVTFSVVSASWQALVFQLEPTLAGSFGALLLAVSVGAIGGSCPPHAQRGPRC